METRFRPKLEDLVAAARGDPDVLAVLLFGSAARGEAGPRSDLDICLVLAPPRPARSEPRALSRKRLEYLARFDLDLRIFQQLPLYVRSRILKEGELLFVRDEDLLYRVALDTARAFERFRRIYHRYLDEVAGARP